MNKEETLNIVEEQVRTSKQFTFGERYITYNYLGVDYNIDWNYTYEPRYGHHIYFCCNFIKNFYIYRKQQNYNTSIIIDSSIEKDNKNIIKKLQILSKRIHEQVEINNFIEKIQKEFTPKVKNFISKDLGSNEINMRFSYITEWNNYKNRNKLIRRFEYLTITVRFNHENVSYHYNFKCFHPSKWDNEYSKIETKKITLQNKNVSYNKKQITNIIRYAKLKNIFANG